MSKVPFRMCIACGEMKEKTKLFRIVRSEDTAEFDPSGKRDGRGAYICRNLECIRLAEKRRGIQRALKVNVPKDVVDRLAKELLSE